MTTTPYLRVTHAVADRFGLHDGHIPQGRSPLHAEARWVVMAVLREQGLSMPQIGRLMHRDHTTVLHGLREVSGRAALQGMATEIAQLVNSENPAEQANHKHTAPTTTESLVIEVESGDRRIRVEVR